MVRLTVPRVLNTQQRERLHTLTGNPDALRVGQGEALYTRRSLSTAEWHEVVGILLDQPIGAREVRRQAYKLEGLQEEGALSEA